MTLPAPYDASAAIDSVDPSILLKHLETLTLMRN